jgi:hypothetical protein
MANDPLTRSMETVNVFRERLTSLYTLCAEVAAQHGAHVDHDVVVQEPFNAQMSTGGLAELPLIHVTSGRVEISLHPAEITSDIHGGYCATLSVGRKLLGAGRLDSPSCWTDLDHASDQQWYAGAVRNKSKPVDADMIASWLRHGGPTPIW